MNVVLLVVGLVVLGVFGAMAGVALTHHVDGAHVSLLPLYNPHELTPGLIFGALSLAVLSFLGFDAISTLSEESRGGSRAIAMATMLSLCICAALFVAQTWLASLFVLGRTSFPPGDTTNAAFYTIAQDVGGYWLKFLLAVPASVFAGTAGNRSRLPPRAGCAAGGATASSRASSQPSASARCRRTRSSSSPP